MKNIIIALFIFSLTLVPASAETSYNDSVEFSKGVIDSKLGNDKGAKVHYNNELKDIKDTAALYNRGNIQARQGHYKEALKDYDEVLKYKDGTDQVKKLNDKQLTDVYNNKAFAELNLNKDNEAIIDINNALRYAKSSSYFSGEQRAKIMLNYCKGH